MKKIYRYNFYFPVTGSNDKKNIIRKNEKKKIVGAGTGWATAQTV